MVKSPGEVLSGGDHRRVKRKLQLDQHCWQVTGGTHSDPTANSRKRPYLCCQVE